MTGWFSAWCNFFEGCRLCNKPGTDYSVSLLTSKHPAKPSTAGNARAWERSGTLPTELFHGVLFSLPDLQDAKVQACTHWTCSHYRAAIWTNLVIMFACTHVFQTLIFVSSTVLYKYTHGNWLESLSGLLYGLNLTQRLSTLQTTVLGWWWASSMQPLRTHLTSEQRSTAGNARAWEFVRQKFGSDSKHQIRLIFCHAS